jgi:heme O synthase-like polyprenyltransferase
MLIPVSLIPALNPTSGSPMVYATWVTLMGAGQLALAIRFALQRDERSARLLLRATLLYLPACMGLLLMVSM